MPTVQTLQSIEQFVELAASNILSSSFGYTNVYTSMDDSVNSPYPRIEIEAAKGSPTGHKFISGSNQVYDQSYRCTLAAYIVSDRADTNVAEHREIVGNIVTALGDNANYTSGSGLTYHCMFRSDFSNQGYQIRDEGENGATYDETAVSFDQVVIIIPRFWP